MPACGAIFAAMKRAIVIGATSGIGRGLAERLASAGYTVGLVGRRENLLDEIAAGDPAAFRRAAADLTRTAEAVAALERLAAELGGMDLCIVCAGTGELNPALAYALEEPAIRTNVAGWTAAVDWACGFFERQGAGHLVCVTSEGCAAAAPPRLTALRKPTRSTMPRGFGSVSPGCGFRSASPTSGPVSRRRRWPGAKAFSG